MDKKDIRILQIMHKNTRVSLATISRKIGLSENAVKYRLKKLEKNRYINEYSLNLNSEKFGKKLQVLFLLNIKPEKIESSLNKIMHYKPFSKVFRCTGHYSVACIGFFDGRSDLQEFLDKKLLVEIPVVECMEQIILKKYKNKYFNIEMV
jgi:Lrp/AsnC family transcriptional regulator, leucine-responsive regulatory protein